MKKDERRLLPWMLILAYMSLFNNVFLLQCHGFSITPSYIVPTLTKQQKHYHPYYHSKSPSHIPKKYRQGIINSNLILRASTQQQESFTSKHLIPNLKVFASTSAIIALDAAFRKSFQAMSISFPSSLAGCTTLFTFLLVVHSVNKEWGDSIHSLFNPGATLLAKWLPVFFVPSLVTLPLAPSLGSTQELLKVSMLLISGFIFSLFTTAYSVLFVRLFTGANQTKAMTPSAVNTLSSLPTSTTTTPSPKPFSNEILNLLSYLAIAFGGLSVTVPQVGALKAFQIPLQSISMLLATLASFVYGARLPKKVTKVIHPVVTCTSIMLVLSQIMGIITQRSFLNMIASYRTKTLSWMSAGAGDILLYMLGPSVVALACQMYSRKHLMRKNMAEVGMAAVVSSMGGLFGTALILRLFDIQNSVVRLSTLSRNVTSPLAIAIAGILGANASLAVSMVVISGLIGANCGAAILDMAGIKDAVARGLGIGAAAHGLGTAAFAEEKDAFPFAAISMALTATGATVLVSIPVIKKALIKLALGV